MGIVSTALHPDAALSTCLPLSCDLGLSLHIAPIHTPHSLCYLHSSLFPNLKLDVFPLWPSLLPTPAPACLLACSPAPPSLPPHLSLVCVCSHKSVFYSLLQKTFPCPVCLFLIFFHYIAYLLCVSFFLCFEIFPVFVLYYLLYF